MVMETILRTIRIFNSRLRSLGFLEMISLISTSLFKIERIIIYVKQLDNKTQFQKYSEVDKFIYKGEIHELITYRENTASRLWEFFCDIYDGVSDFFIFKDKAEIGHISWIYYKHHHNRILDLSKNEAEIKYSFTEPKFRGRGLYPATLVKIQKYLKDNGYRKVFICVDMENIASIKGIQKSGFEILSRIKIIKFMGLQLNKKYSTHKIEE
jgi:RimJ/RimL family protein N-acetyltransferase